MWCDTVACESPTGSVRSQMQASPPALPAMSESSITRAGSPIALNTRATLSASPGAKGEVTRGTQHTVCSIVTGRVTPTVLHVLTNFNRCGKVSY